MNQWKEPYPDDLRKVLNEAFSVAEMIKTRLNDAGCLRIKELYSKKGKVQRRNAKLFEELEYTPNHKLNKKASKKNEFKGVYVLGKKIKGTVVPQYVGISQTIYRRLRQHGWGQNHNECTFAYLMANAKHFQSNFKQKRELFPQDELEEARQTVQRHYVALFGIEKDYNLYLMEVLLSGIFKTKWNSFKTH